MMVEGIGFSDILNLAQSIGIVGTNDHDMTLVLVTMY